MEKNHISTTDKKTQASDAKSRAKIDGNPETFETEKFEKTDTSAIPGAENEIDTGNAASGAGLGGNKGTGTSASPN